MNHCEGQIEAGYNIAAKLQACRQHDTMTLRQSFDAQITAADAHATELRARKERLEASGILDMRIEDLSVAMRR